MSHYVVLGVPTDASEKEVERAYRRRALECHPDKGGGAGAFEALQKAYACLSDPARRAEFDAAAAALDEARENCSAQSYPVAAFKAEAEPFSSQETGEAGWALPCRCGGTFDVFELDLQETVAE
eukprot:gene22772-34896_t